MIMKTLKYYIHKGNLINYTLRIMLICLLPMGAVLTSCSDDDDEEAKFPSRLFRPIAFTSNISENTVGFSWVPISGATYLLELSRDSLLFETDVQSIPLGNVSYYTIGDLWSKTRYSARIKSVSANPNVADSEFQEITFVTQTENIFYIMNDQNIGTDWIVITWLNSKRVSHVTISTVDTQEVTLDISDDEKAIGEKRITGLISGTEYTIRIYLGEMLRGTDIVTTK